jgi:cytochrome c-type biogenesis protein CcmF
VNIALGTAGVVLGLLGALVGIVTLAVGLVRRQPALVRSGRIYAFVILGGALVMVFAMQRALLTDDFTVQFVHDNSSTTTPLLFKIATMWAALEGSLVLWALVLAGFTAVVGWRYRDRITDPLVGWALLTMFVVCLFFFGMLAGPANPFRSITPPIGYDGPGPNPLLQNHPLMAFHPPALYLGYVGFTVPFAFAIGALITGRVGEGWLLGTRRWTLFAWGCLTVGIVAGAWWSYEVLGWGGYWAWDPVENASFLPWLTGTAYLHSVMVQERRGMLRVWNLSLLCATFSLTILGTFLTRSGVLDSVHAFSESSIGPIILGFFALIVVVTVGLIGWRGDRLRAPGRIDSPISREGAFLANNVLFAAFAFVVLLGTVFPLIVEALDGERISVGTPYFNRMTMPLGLTLLFLMAVAPVLPWRKASGELLRHRLLWPAWVGAAFLVVSLVLGARGLAPLLAFFLAGFAGGSAGRQIVLATRRHGWRGFVGRANGGMVVHIGVIVIAVAFAASSSYARQAELTLVPGQTADFAGHTLTYRGVVTKQFANRASVAAQIEVDGAGTYEPALSTFGSGRSLVGTPSVHVTAADDVALSLLALPEGGRADAPVTIRVVVQPLIMWLWVGGGIMAVGTALAIVPTGQRRPTDPVSAAPFSGRSGAGSAAGGGDGDDDGSGDDDAGADASGGAATRPTPGEPAAVG